MFLNVLDLHPQNNQTDPLFSLPIKIGKNWQGAPIVCMHVCLLTHFPILEAVLYALRVVCIYFK